MRTEEEDKISGLANATARLTFTSSAIGSLKNASATATGFFWRSKESVYLITNWHNVTGLRADTLACNGSFKPSDVLIETYVRTTDGTENLGIKEPLFENTIPCWREYPENSKKMDVVALEIRQTSTPAAAFFCVNDVEFDKKFIPLIGDGCFVSGFPEGISGPSSTPIWKRASIASHPHLNHDEQPVFLIDTIGNKGLSGSPVFIVDTVARIVGKDKLSTTVNFGPIVSFLGVYAGRLSDKGIGSQLGRVWKRELIDEIIANKNEPSNPH